MVRSLGGVPLHRSGAIVVRHPFDRGSGHAFGEAQQGSILVVHHKNIAIFARAFNSIASVDKVYQT